MITLLVLVLALAVLGILANRLGADSRDTVWSKERELAAFGIEWSDQAPEPCATPAKSKAQAAHTDLAKAA